MKLPEDNEIIRVVLNGNVNAYGRIVRKYQKPIYNLMFRASQSEQLSMEMTQEVFTRAYEKLDRFDPGRRFFSWLFAIGANLVRDYLRRAGRELLFSEAEIDGNEVVDKRLNHADAEAYVLSLIISMCSPAMAIGKVDGISLFKQQRYTEAAGRLAEALKDQPQNPPMNFYLGRSLLASNRSDKALVYLKKAAGLDPGNSDYRFWEGLGYWATMDFEGERRCYLKALKIDGNHLPANLYLGHNYFDQGNWRKALARYDRVLRLDPGYPDALYYRAIVLEKQKKIFEANKAWKIFLDRYRSGLWAFHAVERLNQNGDFSYRECWLGPVKTILPKISFASGSDRLSGQSREALEKVEEALNRNSALSLHIVVYAQGHVRLAKSRAGALKKHFLHSTPAIRSSRLKLSWFGVPERMVSGDKTHVLKESVHFITATH